MRKTILAAVTAAVITSPALAQDMTADQHTRRAHQLTESAMEYMGRAIGLYNACAGDAYDTRMQVADVVHGIYGPKQSEMFLNLLDVVAERKEDTITSCTTPKEHQADFKRYYRQGSQRLERAIDHTEKAAGL